MKTSFFGVAELYLSEMFQFIAMLRIAGRVRAFIGIAQAGSASTRSVMILDFSITKAGREVIVHHSDRLHKGITDG